MTFVTRLFQASSFAAISAIATASTALYNDPANWQVYVPAILIGIAGVIRSEKGTN